MSIEAGLIIFVAVEIALMCILILVLDGKIWAKIDRVVNFMMTERAEILKKIDEFLKRVEEIEKRIKE